MIALGIFRLVQDRGILGHCTANLTKCIASARVYCGVLCRCTAPCEKGQYSSGGHGHTPCTPCPLGMYQSSTGQSKCDQCPQGMSTAMPGASSASDCAGKS